MYVQKYYKVIRVIKDGDGGATPLYIENVSDSDGEFKLDKNISPTYTPNLIYRIGDNGEWFEYDVTNRPSITVPSGSKIYFRGDNVNGFNQNNSDYYYYFNFTQNYNIGGYITSLLALDNFNTISDIPNYSFNSLFRSSSNLLNTEDLITDNIINVNSHGFRYCFYYCRNLETSPNFKNLTTVNSNGFASCFYYCRNLETSPNFKNITTVSSQGFSNCFYYCTKLQVVYAPSITTWDTSNFGNWLNNVSPTGIIYKPTGLEIPTDSVHGVPEGWSTADY